MTPSDLPSSVIDKIYRAPHADRLSQNDVKALLVHFWPAITEHFAQLLLHQNPDRDADFSAGVDWAADTIRNANRGATP
jgi:hypothetical protein